MVPHNVGHQVRDGANSIEMVLCVYLLFFECAFQITYINCSRCQSVIPETGRNLL